MEKILENGAGRFWLDEEGILRCCVNPGIDQTKADAEHSMGLYTQLAGGQCRPVVIELAGKQAMSREARAVYTGVDAGKVFAAVAIVVTQSAVARTLVNFIINVSKPAFPVRMFETKEDALSWARTQTQNR